ncbi:MAG: glycoside hydrolase family 10 protein [Candidatus Sumerlaeia bacterium]
MILRVCLCLLALAAVFSSVSPAQDAPDPSVTPAFSTDPDNRIESIDPGEAARLSRGIWVYAGDEVLRDEAACRAMMEHLRQMEVSDVFVVVRDMGDAYYKSSLAPNPMGLDIETFDPLQTVLDMAHLPDKRRIRVHAVVNTLLLNRSDNPFEPPLDHLLSLHPEWVNMHIEGYALDAKGESWLDPAIPMGQYHLEAVVHELVSKYEIDGLHLAKLRYPDKDRSWGYNQASVRMYKKESGITDEGVPAPEDPAWVQWRADRLTALVQLLTKAARQARPGIILSISGIADGLPQTDGQKASADFLGALQYWPYWMEKKLMDWIVLDNTIEYELGRTAFAHWIDFANSRAGSVQVVAMISGRNNSESAVRDLALLAMTRKVDGLVLQSWQNPARDLAAGAEGLGALANVLFSPDYEIPTYLQKALMEQMPEQKKDFAGLDMERELPAPLPISTPAPTPTPRREWSQSDAAMALIGKPMGWQGEEEEVTPALTPPPLPPGVSARSGRTADYAPRVWQRVELSSGNSFVAEKLRDEGQSILFLLKDSGAELTIPKSRIASMEVWMGETE